MVQQPAKPGFWPTGTQWLLILLVCIICPCVPLAMGGALLYVAGLAVMVMPIVAALALISGILFATAHRQDRRYTSWSIYCFTAFAVAAALTPAAIRGWRGEPLSDQLNHQQTK